jgi:hypothetical protein
MAIRKQILLSNHTNHDSIKTRLMQFGHVSGSIYLASLILHPFLLLYNNNNNNNNLSRDKKPQKKKLTSKKITPVTS